MQFRRTGRSGSEAGCLGCQLEGTFADSRFDLATPFNSFHSLRSFSRRATDTIIARLFRSRTTSIDFAIDATFLGLSFFYVFSPLVAFEFSCRPRQTRYCFSRDFATRGVYLAFIFFFTQAASVITSKCNAKKERRMKVTCHFFCFLSEYRINLSINVLSTAIA